MFEIRKLSKNTFQITITSLSILSYGVSLAFLTPIASAQTLDETFARARTLNPQLEAEGHQLEVAEQNVTQAKALGRTRLTFETRTDWQRLEVDPNVGVSFGEDHSAQVNIRAQKSIYAGGSVRASVAQARTLVEESKARLDALMQDVYLAAASAHIQIVFDKKALDLSRETLQTLSEEVIAARKRFNAGVITRTDVAATEAQLAAVEAQLETQQAQLLASQARYIAVTGATAHNLVLSDDAFEVSVDMPTAIELLRRNNPNLNILRLQKLAAEFGVKRVEAEYAPSLSFEGRVGAEQNFHDDYPSAQYQANLTLSIPIYKGRGLYARTKSARLETSRITALIRAQERELIAQLSASWYSWQASQRGITAGYKQLEAAELAYSGSQKELAVGVKTTFEVLNSEQRLFQARSALLSAQRDKLFRQAEILALIGQLG